jgi:ribonuclease P/MRP protein subunit RPP40
MCDQRLPSISSVVELNLRLPSMLHGKKGFERIVWAFANVLTQSMAWLFYDLHDSLGTDEGIYTPEPDIADPNHRLKGMK